MASGPGRFLLDDFHRSLINSPLASLSAERGATKIDKANFVQLVVIFLYASLVSNFERASRSLDWMQNRYSSRMSSVMEGADINDWKLIYIYSSLSCLYIELSRSPSCIDAVGVLNVVTIFSSE